MIATLILTLFLGQATPRDTRATVVPPKGSGELEVFVVTDDQQGQPLRRVSVSLQASEMDVPHIGVTDDNGRVVFLGLAAGNYLLTAMRQGYVRTFYGSALPGRGPGIATTVLDGQRVSGIRIRMLRGSVVTGVVRGPTGRPVPNQQVQATMVRTSGGERRATNIEGGLGMVSTDDRGAYRIFGLAPGDYTVSVPSFGGSTDEVRAMTTAELQWADKTVAAGTASPTAPATPAPAGAPSVAYSPVYYPGTTVAADAGVLTLGPNEERSGVDFTLQLVPTAKVSGRVIDAEGRPQGGVGVSIKPARPDGLDLFSAIFNSNASTAADGTFTMYGVKPGSYTLSVRATPKTDAQPAAAADPAAQAREMAAAMFGGGAPGATHWAGEDVTVSGRDIGDVTLTLRPGMTVSGRVVYEATTKPAPADLTKTMLSFLPAPTGTGVNELVMMMTGLGGASSPTIAADGSFTVRGVQPGKYRLNTPFGMMTLLPIGNVSPGGWTLKSVMANGRDIADAPIDIRPGTDVTNVVVTFTDRPSELSGTVFDGAGRVTPNFPIIVFSTDRAYWTLGSRRVQTARPSSDGKYTITGLPAGEYFVCAVTAVDRAEVYDPAFLEQLVGVSFKITMGDGEKKTQDLKLGGK